MTSTQIKIVELRDQREYTNNPRMAINVHSVRCYQVEGNTAPVYLDRNLSVLPPCFELYEFPPIDPADPDRPRFARPILVEGKQYFGDGLTWKQAEQMMHDRMAELFAENTPA